MRLLFKMERGPPDFWRQKAEDGVAADTAQCWKLYGEYFRCGLQLTRGLISLWKLRDIQDSKTQKWQV